MDQTGITPLPANPEPHRPAAFRRDARSHRALSTAKALWWTTNRAAGRAIAKPADDETAPPPGVDTPPPRAGRLRSAWLEAFEKDAADVAAGLYPVTETPPRNVAQPIRRAVDVIADARQVEARRKRGGAVEAREEEGSIGPTYYRQNFHYQTGGWFTADSAKRYEAQVEALFSGAAGAMRRRALSLLAKAWRDQDQRDLKIADIACGSGAFLKDLKGAFPRAAVAGVDLSHAYAQEAGLRSGAGMAQAAAERLPFADVSLDGVSCIYLFHELPPKVRPAVAAELARVLKPGGVLAFADSIQTVDAPDLDRLLQAFPAFFHEPYFASYQATDLSALFAGAGLLPEARDSAFLTKALLFRKPAATGIADA
ncbi:class I SAM-dependent methyltransferase [Caulobacter sp. S45]|uniref:class I SAM-dependent methyltransferase n=1 Tax=Caulobacter sp. S45 TaxID=1641861 RepID=UPI0015751F2A|nr:class I SAM-dependent methyltransferase [Caulobacter sp. S45]